jgi:hypothetical protein
MDQKSRDMYSQPKHRAFCPVLLILCNLLLFLTSAFDESKSRMNWLLAKKIFISVFARKAISDMIVDCRIPIGQYSSVIQGMRKV